MWQIHKTLLGAPIKLWRRVVCAETWCDPVMITALINGTSGRWAVHVHWWKHSPGSVREIHRRDVCVYVSDSEQVWMKMRLVTYYKARQTACSSIILIFACYLACIWRLWLTRSCFGLLLICGEIMWEMMLHRVFEIYVNVCMSTELDSRSAIFYAWKCFWPWMDMCLSLLSYGKAKTSFRILMLQLVMVHTK